MRFMYLIKVPKGNGSLPGSSPWHLSSLSAPPLSQVFGVSGLQGWVLELDQEHFAFPAPLNSSCVGLSGSILLCSLSCAWEVLSKHLQCHDTRAALVSWDGSGLGPLLQFRIL